MTRNDRRAFLQAAAAGAGIAVSGSALALGDDGHAAGRDVAPSAEFLSTISRKAGPAAPFTASLDSGRIKATSGGWARDITTNQLPIATGIAGAHLFLNAGGVREMHWHASTEWGYVVDGRCQVTVVDPDGQTEIVNLGPGDTWLFPSGHAHAIQALGSTACHAILAFDDGLYGEHGTFGLTDWMSRFDPALVAKAVAAPVSLLRTLPEAETYIMQGPIIALDSPAATQVTVLDRTQTHRYALSTQRPLVDSRGGTLTIASAHEFPVSAAMTGFRLVLHPGALHTPHWHPNANEWHYVVAGRARVTLFTRDKHMGAAEIGPGDCAYIPRSCGHSIESIASQPCELVGVHDHGAYVESSLSQWLARVPRHLLAANLGITDAAASAFGSEPIVIAASS